MLAERRVLDVVAAYAGALLERKELHTTVADEAVRASKLLRGRTLGNRKGHQELV
jgi:hypothetical protein